MKNDIPISELNRLLRFDGEKLIWRDRDRSDFFSDCSFSRWHTMYSGKPAGSATSKGYLMFSVTLNRKKYYMLNHRAIWAMTQGKWPREKIDHRDHNKTNNTLKNLREASDHENGKNQSMKANNSSGINGVSFNKRTGKWYAYISINKKRKHLGSFETIKEAADARKSADVLEGYYPNHGATKNE